MHSQEWLCHVRQSGDWRSQERLLCRGFLHVGALQARDASLALGKAAASRRTPRWVLPRGNSGGEAIENCGAGHLFGLLQRLLQATMIRGVSPRRVTGMVQKTLIASRSFQPSAKRPIIFVRTSRTGAHHTTRANHATPTHATTLIQTDDTDSNDGLIHWTESAGQRRIEISEFLKITED